MNDLEWTCSRCGERHRGLPDVAFDEPAHWRALTRWQRLRSKLTPDTCRIRDDEGEFFYVRGVLYVPIEDHEQQLGFGVWGSLSEANFRRFLELYDDPRRVDEPPYFSWLGNSIPGYPETRHLPAHVQTRELELRPTIVLEPSDHPLAVEQRDGISVERALELVEPALHA